jgi:hypothetical protein
MALLNADSYALFAQGSAMAASQHAAYLQPTVRVPSFGIEGMERLVSEQIVRRETFPNAGHVETQTFSPPPSSPHTGQSTIQDPLMTWVLRDRLHRSSEDSNVVSRSEPTSSAATTETSSGRGSLLGSPTGSGSGDASNDSDESDNASSLYFPDCIGSGEYTDGPRRKRARLARAAKWM